MRIIFQRICLLRPTTRMANDKNGFCWRIAIRAFAFLLLLLSLSQSSSCLSCPQSLSLSCVRLSPVTLAGERVGETNLCWELSLNSSYNLREKIATNASNRSGGAEQSIHRFRFRSLLLQWMSSTLSVSLSAASPLAIAGWMRKGNAESGSLYYSIL